MKKILKLLKILCGILFTIEIIGLTIYIIKMKKASLKEEKNTEFLAKINNNLKNIDNNNINKYYYLLEFKRIFVPYKENDKSFGRSDLSNIVDYFFIPTYILIIISTILSFLDKYKIPLYMLYISLFLSFFAFINSLFYPYKVNIPGKEIYIFSEELNDEIKTKLDDKLDSKIYFVGSTIVLIISIIAHIIISHILFSQENKKDNIIISPLVKENNNKENNDNENNSIIEPICN